MILSCLWCLAYFTWSNPLWNIYHCIRICMPFCVCDRITTVHFSIRTFDLALKFDCCEQCGNEHDSADFSLLYWLQIFWVKIQKWDCWIIYNFAFSVLKTVWIDVHNDWTKFQACQQCVHGGFTFLSLATLVIIYLFVDNLTRMMWDLWFLCEFPYLLVMLISFDLLVGHPYVFFWEIFFQSPFLKI